MEKFGILVNFPASIMFTVDAESQEAAEEIIKDIIDEFNPDDVKLEYDANLKLLKTVEALELNNQEAELEALAEAVTKIPVDEMIAILQDLMYFSDVLLEYNYDNDEVIVTSLNFPHDTYEDEDEYRREYPVRTFIENMTRHLLFHKDVRKEYQQQFIKVMKGLMAVSTYFDDMSWANEAVRQKNLTEAHAKTSITNWIFDTFNSAVPYDERGTLFSRVAFFIINVLSDSLLKSDMLDLHFMSRYVQLIVGDFNELYRLPHYDELHTFTEEQQANYRRFIMDFVKHIPIIAEMIYETYKKDLGAVSPTEIIKAINRRLKKVIPDWVGKIEIYRDDPDLSWANETVDIHKLTKENIMSSISDWLYSTIVTTNTVHKLASIIDNIDVLTATLKTGQQFHPSVLSVVHARRGNHLHKLHIIIGENIYDYDVNDDTSLNKIKEDLITNIPRLATIIYDAKFSSINFAKPNAADSLDRAVRAINYLFSPSKYPVEFTLHNLEDDLSWVNESKEGRGYE